MRVPDSNLVYLKKALPDLIRDIKVYTGMDNDFEKLCQDYEELTDTINYLEEKGDGNFKLIKIQVTQHKLLQTELLNEIINFINEEQKQN